MTVSRSYRISEATDLAVKRLVASLGKKSEAEVIEAAVKALDEHRAEAAIDVRQLFRETWIRLDEILETVQSQPEPVTGSGFDPRSIPGVQTGQNFTPTPRRESGNERAQRERREREERARAQDRSGQDRDDIDRSDDYVSG